MSGEAKSGGAGSDARRSDDRWIWLLADLSLDRATTVIPCLGFPMADCRPFQSLVRRCDEFLVPGGSFNRDIYPQFVQGLRGQFGPSAREIWKWLTSFPCDEEAIRPAPAYWDRTLQDLLAVDPVPAPEPVDPQTWCLLRDALRLRIEPQGQVPSAAQPSASPLHSRMATGIAEVNRRYRLAFEAIDAAREQPLSKHDAGRYLSFGWNDHGMRKGLACLEHGNRMFWIMQLWRVFAPALSLDERRAIERLAQRRDREIWLAVRDDPTILGPDAARHGVERVDMLNQLFPEPPPPPPLDLLAM